MTKLALGSFVVLGLSSFLGSCGVEEQTKVSSVELVSFDDLDCYSGGTAYELIDKGLSEALEFYGEPITEVLLNLNNATLHEFRAPLINLRQEIDPAIEYPMREITWGQGDCRLTVWAHTPSDSWAIYDAFFYDKEVEF